RGGLQAWRAVQSMSWTGKMDAGGGDSTARSRDFVMGKRHHPTKTELMGKKNAEKDEANKQVQLPFVMEMKRPRKSRVEIEFAGDTAPDGRENAQCVDLSARVQTGSGRHDSLYPGNRGGWISQHAQDDH